MADDSQISIDLCEMETELEAGAVKLGLGGVQDARCGGLACAGCIQATPRWRGAGQSASLSLAFSVCLFLSLTITFSVSISPLCPLDLEVLSDCEDAAVTCHLIHCVCVALCL